MTAFEDARAGGVIDTMIGVPVSREQQRHAYDFIRKQAMDRETQEMEFPAEYMFKGVPHFEQVDDPLDMLVSLMDHFGIVKAPTGTGEDPVSERALREFPDRFFGTCQVDANEGMEAVRKLDRAVREHGVKAAHCWGTGLIPQVALNDKKMYPVYAKCVELDIPIFVYAGVPGPRIRFEPQYVGLLDEVCWFFPELRIITRHGGEPWTELMVKLLLKWPNLYYSTSAFAPKHYNAHIIDFANTRGADKVIYAGYFPMGLSLDRIFSELPDVPFRDHVWPKFLRENAARVLKLDT
ncbi:MAG: amidohydrolase family protein [Acidimicrobiia bacterium]